MTTPIGAQYGMTDPTAALAYRYGTCWLRLTLGDFSISLLAGQRVWPFSYGVDEVCPLESGAIPPADAYWLADLASTSCFRGGALMEPESGTHYLIKGVAARVLRPRCVTPGAVSRPAWLRSVARDLRDAAQEVATASITTHDRKQTMPIAALGPLHSFPHFGDVNPARVTTEAPFLPLAVPVFVDRRARNGSLVVETAEDAAIECMEARADMPGVFVLPVRVWLFGETYNAGDLYSGGMR